MTIGDIRTRLDYHYWARDRLLDRVHDDTSVAGAAGQAPFWQIRARV